MGTHSCVFIATLSGFTLLAATCKSSTIKRVITVAVSCQLQSGYRATILRYTTRIFFISPTRDRSCYCLLAIMQFMWNDKRLNMEMKSHKYKLFTHDRHQERGVNIGYCRYTIQLMHYSHF
jgi:hypothetical protein